MKLYKFELKDWGYNTHFGVTCQVVVLAESEEAARALAIQEDKSCKDFICSEIPTDSGAEVVSVSHHSQQ